MADENILTDDFIRQLINVGEVDILVGVPTHNDAKTVQSAIQAIQAGILRSFPRERAVIINADAGSTDGTPELVVELPSATSGADSTATRCERSTPSVRNTRRVHHRRLRCAPSSPRPKFLGLRPAP